MTPASIAAASRLDGVGCRSARWLRAAASTRRSISASPAKAGSSADQRSALHVDRAPDPSPVDPPIEARPLAGMARRPGGIDDQPHRVLVAIDPHLAHRHRVARRRALAPQLARLRDQNTASPLSTVARNASAFMCATISTAPESPSVTTAVISPSAPHFGSSVSPVSRESVISSPLAARTGATKCAIGMMTNARQSRIAVTIWPSRHSIRTPHADDQSVRLTTSCARSAACSACPAPTAPRRWSRSACTRSSIAGRKPPASPAWTAPISTATARWAMSPGNFDRDEIMAALRGDVAVRPRPLFDHRRDRAAQRPAALRRTRHRRLRGRAQRQHLERDVPARRPRRARRDLPVDQRHRGDLHLVATSQLPRPARQVRRRAAPGRGRLFADRDDAAGDDRVPRPARHPPAGDGPARRRLYLRRRRPSRSTWSAPSSCARSIRASW